MELCRRQSWLFSRYSLCFLLLLHTVTSTKDACLQLMVSGAINQTAANGLYDLADDLHCNDKPAWREQGGEDYLYYLEEGYYGWMIGSSTCYDWGGFLIGVKSHSDKPYHVTETWTEYNPSSEHFEDNFGIIVECRKVFNPCTTEPCRNNGACIGFKNSTYSCTCPVGYAGKQCEIVSGIVPFVAICVAALVIAIILLTTLGVLCYLRSKRLHQQQRHSVLPETSDPSPATFNYTMLVNESTRGHTKYDRKTDEDI